MSKIDFNRLTGVPKTSLKRSDAPPIQKGLDNVFNYLIGRGRMIKVGDPPLIILHPDLSVSTNLLEGLCRRLGAKSEIIYLDDLSQSFSDELFKVDSSGLESAVNQIYGRLQKQNCLIKTPDLFFLQGKLGAVNDLFEEQAKRKQEIANWSWSKGKGESTKRWEVKAHLEIIRKRQDERIADGKFHPLVITEGDLTCLWQKMFRYTFVDRCLHIKSKKYDDLLGFYTAMLYLNHAGNKVIGPDLFRFFMGRLSRVQIKELLSSRPKLRPDNTVLIDPLPGGLFFAEAFRAEGFSQVDHLLLRKKPNQIDLELSKELKVNYNRPEYFILADSSIAVGSTFHFILQWLDQQKLLTTERFAKPGNENEIERRVGTNVFAVTNFAAPEGLYRSRYPYEGLEFWVAGMEEATDSEAITSPLQVNPDTIAFGGDPAEVMSYIQAHFVPTKIEKDKLIPLILEGIKTPV
ncbi:MAG: hypothetical protein PHH14_07440 [Candidatus Margulisbacteria bacterium]|nr:hypothetical protein [Candidatus Margulisiibacteriota bacterium]